MNKCNKGVVNNLRVGLQSTVEQHLQINKDRVTAILDDMFDNNTDQESEDFQELSEIEKMYEQKLIYVKGEEWRNT